MSLASETALSHSMGQNGFKYLSTAGTATYSEKKMCAITAITESAITLTSGIGGDDLTAITIPAGLTIVGFFNSVTVSGTGARVLAYLAER